jgi:hypothetical protein
MATVSPVKIVFTNFADIQADKTIDWWTLGVLLYVTCLSTKPEACPTTRDILDHLRAIEAEILLRPSEDEDVNVGSVRFMTGSKRPERGLH